MRTVVFTDKKGERKREVVLYFSKIKLHACIVHARQEYK